MFQKGDSSLTAVTKLPSAYFRQVEKKSAQLENKITARSEKALPHTGARIKANKKSNAGSSMRGWL